jgi:hypothetical protein
MRLTDKAFRACFAGLIKGAKIVYVSIVFGRALCYLFARPTDSTAVSNRQLLVLLQVPL